jgi:hypothetical protein
MSFIDTYMHACMEGRLQRTFHFIQMGTDDLASTQFILHVLMEISLPDGLISLVRFQTGVQREGGGGFVEFNGG